MKIKLACLRYVGNNKIFLGNNVFYLKTKIA